MCQFKPASGLFHWPTGLPWLLYLLKHAHGLSVLCHANKTCSDNRYFLSLVCASPWEYNVAPDPMPSLSSGRLGWWTSAGLACSEPSPLSDSSPILHWRADPTRFRWVRSQHPLPKVSIQTWPMSISTGYFASTGKTEFSYLWGFFFFFILVVVFFFWLHFVAWGFSVPQPGIKPCCLQWKHRVSITGPLDHQGSPSSVGFKAELLKGAMLPEIEANLESIQVYRWSTCFQLCLMFKKLLGFPILSQNKNFLIYYYSF